MDRTERSSGPTPAEEGPDLAFTSSRRYRKGTGLRRPRLLPQPFETHPMSGVSRLPFYVYSESHGSFCSVIRSQDPTCTCRGLSSPPTPNPVLAHRTPLPPFVLTHNHTITESRTMLGPLRRSGIRTKYMFLWLRPTYEFQYPTSVLSKRLES